jgi:hypothetical protein
MKVICAWCNARIGGQGPDLTHGICKRCYREMMQPKFDFMESLPDFEIISRRARLSRPKRLVTVPQTPPQLFP